MPLKTLGDDPARSIGLPAKATTSSLAEIILARPLFSPSRSAFRAAGVAAITPPRLAGIIITSGARAGVFCDRNGHQRVVENGAILGSFAVIAINTDSVLVSGPDGIALLHIRYGSNQPRETLAGPTAQANRAAAFTRLNSWPSQMDATAP